MLPPRKRSVCPIQILDTSCPLPQQSCVRVALRETVTPAMDPQHADDLARISLDSIHDWHNLKANYTSASLRALDEELAGTPSAERDALLAHFHQVR